MRPNRCGRFLSATLELGSVNRLVIELRDRNFRSKVRKLSTGGTRGGVAFTQGPLFYLLRNRFYIGEVRYKNEICPGPQPPLIKRELFEAVQAKLTEQRSHQVTRRTKSAALLRGLLFDDAGHRYDPNPCDEEWSSLSLLRLTALSSGNSQAAYRGDHPRSCRRDRNDRDQGGRGAHLGNRTRSTIGQEAPDQNVVSANVSRVEVRKNQLAVWLKNLEANEAETDASRPFDRERGPSLLIPWCKPPSKKSREILLPPSVARQDVRPIKVERRAALLRSIARGHAWLEAVASGVETVEEIAARHKCSVRHVNMTISMAFIAPGLVKAAVEGRLPRGIGIANLRDAPAEWSRQYERLGYQPNSGLIGVRYRYYVSQTLAVWLKKRQMKLRLDQPATHSGATDFPSISMAQPAGTGFFLAETSSRKISTSPTGTGRSSVQNVG